MYPMLQIPKLEFKNEIYEFYTMKIDILKALASNKNSILFVSKKISFHGKWYGVMLWYILLDSLYISATKLHHF